VFGKVESGMDIVTRIDEMAKKYGTRDGKVPSDKRVVVIKCGTV